MSVKQAVSDTLPDGGKMMKGAAMADQHYGITLRDERVKLGLSAKKLALLADVSRGTLALAEEGANIELDTLRKLAGALGIREIDIGGLLVHTRTASGVNPTALAALADAIDLHAETGRQIATRVRNFATVGVGKSRSNDTPSKEGVSAHAAQLADLVFEFARQVQTETDPKRLKKLERDVSGLLHRSTA